MTDQEKKKYPRYIEADPKLRVYYDAIADLKDAGNPFEKTYDWLRYFPQEVQVLIQKSYDRPGGSQKADELKKMLFWHRMYPSERIGEDPCQGRDGEYQYLYIALNEIIEPVREISHQIVLTHSVVYLFDKLKKLQPMEKESDVKKNESDVQEKGSEIAVLQSKVECLLKLALITNRRMSVLEGNQKTSENDVSSSLEGL